MALANDIQYAAEKGRYTPEDTPPATKRAKKKPWTPAYGVQDRFVGEHERREITGVPRQTWWREERAGRAPRRVQITANRVGWRLSELLRWMDERPRVPLKGA